jgi:uncharacterized membrane protein
VLSAGAAELNCLGNREMTSERIWIVVAAVMAAVAGVFLWWNNMSAAFVTATLGAVAWFLSYRAQIRARLAATEADVEEAETIEDTNEK